MNFKTMPLIALTIITCILSLSASADYVIHARQLINGVAKQAKESISIIIANNKIKAVKLGYIDPQEGQQLVDLKYHIVISEPMNMLVIAKNIFKNITFL